MPPVSLAERAAEPAPQPGQPAVRRAVCLSAADSGPRRSSRAWTAAAMPGGAHPPGSAAGGGSMRHVGPSAAGSPVPAAAARHLRTGRDGGGMTSGGSGRPGSPAMARAPAAARARRAPASPVRASRRRQDVGTRQRDRRLVRRFRRQVRRQAARRRLRRLFGTGSLLGRRPASSRPESSPTQACHAALTLVAPVGAASSRSSGCAESSSLTGFLSAYSRIGVGGDDPHRHGARLSGHSPANRERTGAY